MITMYNATLSRSTRVLWLLEELGAPYEMVSVEIARPDGSGGPDPANPHPLKQVPCIRDGGAMIVESLATRTPRRSQSRVARRQAGPAR